MIKLDVKDYCHSCPSFEAEVDGPSVTALDFRNKSTEIFVGNVTISCKKRYICAHLINHLRKETEKND